MQDFIDQDAEDGLIACVCFVVFFLANLKAAF
jgi:hypothetical protein